MRLPRWALGLMTTKERRDYRIIQAIAAGASPTQAAGKHGVSERTAYRRGLVRRGLALRPKAENSPTSKAG